MHLLINATRASAFASVEMPCHDFLRSALRIYHLKSTDRIHHERLRCVYTCTPIISPIQRSRHVRDTTIQYLTAIFKSSLKGTHTFLRTGIREDVPPAPPLDQQSLARRIASHTHRSRSRSTTTATTTTTVAGCFTHRAENRMSVAPVDFPATFALLDAFAPGVVVSGCVRGISRIGGCFRSHTGRKGVRKRE